ncbi:unnamed protein product, partial [Rotaria sordida]
ICHTNDTMIFHMNDRMIHQIYLDSSNARHSDISYGW